MKKILRGTVVLLIAIAMIFSSVAIADSQDKQNQKILVSDNIISGEGLGARGDIVWDNGMNYDGLLAAQEPITTGHIDAYPADDFHFEEDTEVCDVHWIGGYWNGDPQEWDWCILFYYDRGDGCAPGNVYAGKFCYAWTDINKEELEPGIWEMWIDLPENILFPAAYVWWISIWAVGDDLPQSGWGYHWEPITMHEGVFKSEYWGFPDWRDLSDLLGDPMDLCFQLTTKEDPVPPTAPTIDGPPEGNPGIEYAFTFHSYDENGDMVRYHIDWGDGSTDTTDWYPACTPVTVYHTYATKGTYIITAYAEDESGLVSPSSSFTIVIPRNKAINNPILNWLNSHPNLFSLLQILICKLGFGL